MLTISKKYLPGIQLPENLVAKPDLEEVVKDATALVFVLPHQCEFQAWFINRL